MLLCIFIHTQSNQPASLWREWTTWIRNEISLHISVTLGIFVSYVVFLGTTTNWLWCYHHRLVHFRVKLLSSGIYHWFGSIQKCDWKHAQKWIGIIYIIILLKFRWREQSEADICVLVCKRERKREWVKEKKKHVSKIHEGKLPPLYT